MARTWSMDVVAPTFKEFSAGELQGHLEKQAAEEGGTADGAGDEDTADETFAARHEVVLLKMKTRIDELKREFGDVKTQKRRR